MAIGVFAISFSRKYGGSERGSELSRFPLIISTCTLAAAIFGLLGTDALFPIWSSSSNMTAYSVYISFENFFFFATIWIFALKYHETATDISVMLGSEITSLLADNTTEKEINTIKVKVQERRRKYRIINSVNLTTNAICSSVYVLAYGE